MKATRKGAYSRIGIILLCCMVYFVSYFSRKDFAAVMVGMLSVGAVGRHTAGLIGTMLFICYGTGQLVSGYLGDKIKPKHLIVIGLVTTGVCNALMPYASEGAMIVIWGINGLAQAMLWPPIVKILSLYLDNQTYVTAHLAVTSAAHVATILLYVYVPLCLTFFDWSTVFLTASLLALASVLIFAITLRIILPKEVEICDTHTPVSKKNAENKERGGDKTASAGIISILRDSGVLTVFVCIIVCGFLRDGIESWLPTLYSEAFDRDVSESILVSIILPIFSIFSITFITALHKRGLFDNEVSGAAVLFAISLVLAIPLTVLVNLDGVAFSIISLVLTAFICSAINGVNFLLISCLPGRFAATGRAATVSGVCNSCVYIGAAISMYGIAVISESLGWSMTIASWIALCAIGIIFCFLSYKKYTRCIYPSDDN